MPSIFTRIIAGEIPCHKLWEDDHHLAFLDIRPVQPGHTLVIPKREVSYLFDLEPAEYARLWEAVRHVADRLKRATSCERLVISVVGWEVPHTHVHLVPTNDISDFGFPGPCGMEAEAIADLAVELAPAFAEEPDR